jgi:hypothetical protein
LATLRRDKDTVRTMLFTAGVAADVVPTVPHADQAPAATDAQVAPFEWPELADAEADVDVRAMVADYLQQTRVDPDQVRA